MLFFGNNFHPHKDIPDLTGKVYIVTGGTAGIGYGIVVHLLQHNAAKIIVLSSNEASFKASLEDLKNWGDVSRVEWTQCDLTHLKQVDEVAKKLKSNEKRVDGLILNAGIGVKTYQLTNDNLDRHFQINFLSQLLLLLILLPTLFSTFEQTQDPTRIVFMSSPMYYLTPSSTKFASVEELNQDLGGARLYGRSKIAQILGAQELARRLDAGELGGPKSSADRTGKARPIYVNAVHPAGVKTASQQQATDTYGWKGWLMMAIVRPFFSDPVSVGCRSALFAATSAEVYGGQGITGAYIAPDKKVVNPRLGRDVQMGERLWKLSLDLLKEKVGFPGP